MRYTQFHTTALCSPTRAALLTGRNHHSVATGALSNGSTGYPGYNSIIPQSAATFAKVLQAYGYSTAWFGKNHNVPEWEATEAGPFEPLMTLRLRLIIPPNILRCWATRESTIMAGWLVRCGVSLGLTKTTTPSMCCT
ncbi:sulfatase-like hydrolase/transferase [Coleofasciculus sp. F4-SAH-05]|uniref:sulfatase-like hydrolase/transferase n=1 Tax=Coleofasciculus sp. F4-SAH-05 TaxID=3069525 RepID=UPI0032FB298E